MELQTEKTSVPNEAQVREAVGVLQATGYERLQSLGWNLLPNHFYEPVVDVAHVRAKPHTWEERDPPGIDWDVDHQMAVATEVSHYIDELRDIPETAEPGAQGQIEFHWQNNWWTRADPMVQYGLIRSRKPRHYIEIGCGMSSLIVEKALRKNDNSNPDKPGGCEVTLIDPSEKPGIWEHLPNGWTLHQAQIQDAPLELYDQLEAGDMLFYDGSHCSKTGSDVNWMFFQVLPRLAPGVLVHFHDIFMPRDYPQHWILDMHKSWNEQYVLQAFLMHNSAWQIEIANAYLSHKKGPELRELYQNLQVAYGGSIWLTRKA